MEAIVEAEEHGETPHSVSVREGARRKKKTKKQNPQSLNKLVKILFSHRGPSTGHVIKTHMKNQPLNRAQQSQEFIHDCWNCGTSY
ncbi:hypothetical protein JOB18_027728 [Solea senegalensis]|uniref:Uncharacterized protein n=1 Tax=Solea senegalensis TaxID=28829 RepID=A0AAV6RD06_SOLSE|nr:hypothetical protein JOB18_027728 [Solea senegalensis]